MLYNKDSHLILIFDNKVLNNSTITCTDRWVGLQVLYNVTATGNRKRIVNNWNRKLTTTSVRTHLHYPTNNYPTSAINKHHEMIMWYKVITCLSQLPCISLTSCTPSSTLPTSNKHNSLCTHTTATKSQSQSCVSMSRSLIYERAPTHVNKKRKIQLEILDFRQNWTVTAYFDNTRSTTCFPTVMLESNPLKPKHLCFYVTSPKIPRTNYSQVLLQSWFFIIFLPPHMTTR